MHVRLTEIRLRPTGKKVRMARDVEVESLFIGRGPDNDLSLKGLTISLHQATMRMSEGRIYIEAAPSQSISVNGLITTGERLAVGDEIRIGSWEVRVLEPEAGVDIALEYEEVDRGQNDRYVLDARSHLGLEKGLFARRPLSWAAVTIILVGLLVVPLAWAPAQSPWATGDVSHGHAYIENDCQQCHSGVFQAVQNSNCLTCHYDTGLHAAPESGVEAIENAACSDCHLEHRGREASLADRGSIACAECHSKISEVAPGTELENVSDFGTDHPTFKLSVVTDPHNDPESIKMGPDVVEDSGLLFNHFMHVGNSVTNLDDEEQFLNCSSCHTPDADGRAMLPVSFEESCQNCHSLAFDESAPDRVAPHGDAGEVRTFIREFYWTRILSGELTDKSAPYELRSRPRGASLTESESVISRRWVDGKLADAEKRFFGPSGACRTCHESEQGTASDGGMGVRQVRLQEVWAPGVLFSHDTHTPFTCARCHSAAALLDPDSDLPRPDWSLEGRIPFELILLDESMTTSEEAADILIPGIETCRECQAGPSASGRGVVPSPCSTCHPFHNQDHGIMH